MIKLDPLAVAFSQLHPTQREQARWWMSTATLRQIIAGFQFPTSGAVATNSGINTMFDIPISFDDRMEIGAVRLEVTAIEVKLG